MLCFTDKCDQNMVADVVFFIDSSWTVRKQNFDEYLHIASDIVRRFVIGPDAVRVALVRYSEGADVVFFLNAHGSEASVLEAISSVQNYPGNRMLGKVLREAAGSVLIPNKGRRPEIPAVSVIFVTGYPDDKFLNASKELKKIGHVIALGTKAAKDDLVTTLASEPSKNFSFFAPDFWSFHSMAEDIARSVCNVALVKDKCRLNGGFMMNQG